MDVANDNPNDAWNKERPFAVKAQRFIERFGRKSTGEIIPFNDGVGTARRIAQRQIDEDRVWGHW